MQLTTIAERLAGFGIGLVGVWTLTENLKSVSGRGHPQPLGTPMPSVVTTPVQPRHALRARLTGPGGFYNLGNAFGLVTGLWLNVVAMQTDTVAGYLAGSPSAIALTLAMIVFFWSGECYHQAWADGSPPDQALNRRGDFLSGVGAMFLAVGLMFLGQPLMAATAGLLHALGKFGSAWNWRSHFAATVDWPRFWRRLVPLSRVPAVLAILVSAAQMVATGALLNALGPITMLICYGLWIRADLLLMSPAR